MKIERTNFSITRTRLGQDSTVYRRKRADTIGIAETTTWGSANRGREIDETGRDDASSVGSRTTDNYRENA